MLPEEAAKSHEQTSFGGRLRRARQGQKKTLRQVASSAGVSIAYLSDLERGVLENPTLDKLRGIAAALDVSLNELLDVPGPGREPAREPSALREFVESDRFLSLTKEQARRLRRDPASLRKEWLEVLGAINLGGLQPRTVSDYAFVFETIRHAIEPG